MQLSFSRKNSSEGAATHLCEPRHRTSRASEGFAQSAQAAGSGVVSWELVEVSGRFPAVAPAEGPAGSAALLLFQGVWSPIESTQPGKNASINPTFITILHPRLSKLWSKRNPASPCRFAMRQSLCQVGWAHPVGECLLAGGELFPAGGDYFRFTEIGLFAGCSPTAGAPAG